MKDQELVLTNVPVDELIDRLAEKVVSKLSQTNNTEFPSPSSSEDILFKSIKAAACHYGVCYQTISKNLGKINHLKIGRSIKIYKSEIEKGIQKYGIMSKKGGRK